MLSTSYLIVPYPHPKTNTLLSSHLTLLVVEATHSHTHTLTRTPNSDRGWGTVATCQNKSRKQESSKKTDVWTGWKRWQQWMGKMPVQATKRCAHAITHTPTHRYSCWCICPHFLSVSHTQTHYTLSVSLSTLVLQIITCLLSQCQSLGRRQRDIGKVIIGKIYAAVITCTRGNKNTSPVGGSRLWGVRVVYYKVRFMCHLDTEDTVFNVMKVSLLFPIWLQVKIQSSHPGKKCSKKSLTAQSFCPELRRMPRCRNSEALNWSCSLLEFITEVIPFRNFITEWALNALPEYHVSKLKFSEL